MSANLHTIDETPMAPIVSEYGLKRSAARLEFYVNNPARAKEAAEKIASLGLDGIHAVYYKVKDGKGGYQYLPASGSKLDPALDACYRYLTSTYASPQSPDLVCFPAENWNIKEATEYFKGDHGTATWENQHIPLIIVGPGIKKGVISHAPARLVDVAPTILAAMGLKSEKMDGVVLADALVSAPEELVRAQEAVNAQLTPLRDALKRRHDQDLMRTASTRSLEGARDAGQVSQMGQSERWMQYFKQLDRNKDGKVTREEAGNARWFDWLDRNKDGAITPDEIGQQTPLKPPTSSTVGKVKVGRKVVFEFTRDYTPGTRDSKGQMRTGQELMRIIAYRGQLFASTSTFTDPRIYTNDPDYTGCQVLRKSSSKSEWEVDVSFGRRYLRTDCLEVVRFTRDANGRPLPKPVEMLVAGLWDIGEIGWLPPGSEDVIARMEVYRGVAKQIFGRDFRGAGLMVAGLNRYITVAIRDDATGKWIISRVARVPDSERGFASVRAMKVYRDKVTGREYLFVGASYGALYKGVYDPSVPGKIRWLDDPELDASFGRIHSMCECNGSLYVSTDYGGLTVQNQRGGIFRRIDGVKPKWERVYFNYDPRYPTWNQTARGITAVPAEDGSGKEVILAAVEWPPEPIIVRIEPHRGHRAVVELNYYDYFTAVFGRPPKILGGSKQNPQAGVICAALNYFEPFVNPETGKIERFVTLFLVHPDEPAEEANGAYFLIRRAPGVYDWGEIPSGLPAGQHLRGTRTIEKSPFPDEPNTYYFGGFFAGPDEQPPRPNTAWIYKGKYKSTVEVGKP